MLFIIIINKRLIIENYNVNNTENQIDMTFVGCKEGGPEIFCKPSLVFTELKEDLQPSQFKN